MFAKMRRRDGFDFNGTVPAALSPIQIGCPIERRMNGQRTKLLSLVRSGIHYCFPFSLLNQKAEPSKFTKRPSNMSNVRRRRRRIYHGEEQEDARKSSENASSKDDSEFEILKKKLKGGFKE